MTNLIARIKQHEGFRTHPYKDSVGKLTIGYGRNIEDNGISEAEAETMLRHDVLAAQDAAGQFTWYRKQNAARKDVLTEMVFNMGLPRVLGFKKMIQALRDDDHEEAAYQMMDSKWAIQVGKRAETLSSLMSHG